MKPQTLAIARALEARHPTLAALAGPLTQAASALCACHARDGLVLICGNGGSAADAAHITGELVKGFRSARAPDAPALARLSQAFSDAPELAGRLQRGLRAVNLCEASASLTAIANDLSPELIFAQQVFALGRPGDVLIGLSTSGNALNVTRALQAARAAGLRTIGFTGANPGRMAAYCDLLLMAPAAETYLVQELHLPLYHALCAMAEAELFG